MGDAKCDGKGNGDAKHDGNFSVSVDDSTPNAGQEGPKNENAAIPAKSEDAVTKKEFAQQLKQLGDQLKPILEEKDNMIAERDEMISQLSQRCDELEQLQ